MIVLTAIVAGATALFILGPLLGWGASPALETATATAPRDQELLRQREELLAGIKDLEFEYEVGKLTREDYERTRARLTEQAVDVYRELDEHARS